MNYAQRSFSPAWRYFGAPVATGCEKLKARDNLNKGVQAFKSAKYTQAVEHFKEAVRLDPEFPTARLVPGYRLHEPVHPGRGIAGKHAKRPGRRAGVPQGSRGDPKNTVAIELTRLPALQSGAGRQRSGKEDEEARRGHEMVHEAGRSRAEEQRRRLQPWCHHVGASGIPKLMEARSKLGMKPEDPGPIKDKKVQEELKANGDPVKTVSSICRRRFRSIPNTTMPWRT